MSAKQSTAHIKILCLIKGDEGGAFDVVRQAVDPDRTLMGFLQETYDAAADGAAWDRAALERAPLRAAPGPPSDKA